MKIVDSETALKDFERFVELLKVGNRKLEKLEEEKDDFIKSIEFGNIIVDDEGGVICKLEDALSFDDGTESLSQLKFGKRRITVRELEKHMIGKNDIEKTRKMLSYLTGVNSGLIEKIQGDDFMVLNQIAAFFLPR